MTDPFGRNIDYLRVSVTDRCNFRCVYCMPEEGMAFQSHDHDLTADELSTVARAAARLGVRKVRLTGGEPLVRRDIVDVVRRVRAAGIAEISLTTNGQMLAEMASDLQAAGLDRVNISLDSLRPDVFRKVARGGDFDAVWASIETALRVGLHPVKINVVAMQGINDAEAADFAALTLDRPLHVRFIELMPIGKPHFTVAQDRVLWSGFVGQVAPVHSSLSTAHPPETPHPLTPSPPRGEGEPERQPPLAPPSEGGGPEFQGVGLRHERLVPPPPEEVGRGHIWNSMARHVGVALPQPLPKGGGPEVHAARPLHETAVPLLPKEGPGEVRPPVPLSHKGRGAGGEGYEAAPNLDLLNVLGVTGTSELFVPLSEIRARIETLGVLEPASVSTAGPARAFRLPGAMGTIGFISQISDTACANCNRMRVTPDGKLRPCLMETGEVDLRAALRAGAGVEEMMALFLRALDRKPFAHDLANGHFADDRTMSQIGG